MLPSSVVRLRWARVGVGSLGYDVVGVEVLEALEPDQLLEGGVDPAPRASTTCCSTSENGVLMGPVSDARRGPAPPGDR